MKKIYKMKKIAIFTFLFFVSLVHCYSQSGSKHFTIKVSSVENIETNTETIGKWHNEGLDYTLSLLSKETNLDRGTFTLLFNKYLSDFYKSKGVNVDITFDGNYEDMHNESKVTTCEESSNMSIAAKELACKIQNNFDNFIFEKITLSEFIKNAEDLRIESEKLENQTEKMICGIAASINKHSVAYWNENYEKYFNIFFGLFSKNNNNTNHGPSINFNETNVLKINWWTFAGADLMGAWRWGRVGAVVAGGPAGAIACGLAGAAGHSAANLVGQGILQTISD